MRVRQMENWLVTMPYPCRSRLQRVATEQRPLWIDSGQASQAGYPKSILNVRVRRTAKGRDPKGYQRLMPTAPRDLGTARVKPVRGPWLRRTPNVRTGSRADGSRCHVPRDGAQLCRSSSKGESLSEACHFAEGRCAPRPCAPCPGCARWRHVAVGLTAPCPETWRAALPSILQSRLLWDVARQTAFLRSPLARARHHSVRRRGTPV